MDDPQSAAAHFKLALPDSCPDEFIAEIVADFDLPTPMIQVSKRKNEMYAAFEWTVPTQFFVTIGTVYLTELVKEVSKEYTPKLIAGVKALARRCKGMNIRWISAGQSTEEFSRKYYQSAAFSLVLQLKGGQRVKMLFDEALSPEAWDEAIDGLLTTVVTNYTHYPNDPLTKEITKGEKPSTSLYVVHNRESQAWELHDDQSMLAMQRGTLPKIEN